MNKEAQEWLGLALADFPVYIACLAIVTTYFLPGGTLDTFLMAVAVLACIVSCAIGMRTDSKLSGLTNFMKLVCYPLCVIGALVLGAVNVYYWNT